MKAIKIILVIIVIGVIGFFVWSWSSEGSGIQQSEETVVESTNPFIPKIEREIDSLKRSSREEFSKSFFEDTQAELETFYNAGDLGKDSLQNMEEYKSLSKTLFAAYVPNFIDEAHHKLEQSTWDNKELKFIRNEIEEIRNNQFFHTASSSYNSEFKEMENTISEYYKIASFIQQSKNFPTNLDYSVDGRFPIDDVEEKIAQSKLHLYNSSNHIYINNVNWLKEGLKKIPNQMYQKNVDFLKTQMQKNTGEYEDSDLDSQAEYSRQVYQPLKWSLDEFDNDIYDMDYYSVFRSDYRELKDMLDNDNEKAGKYFKEKWEEEMKTK